MTDPTPLADARSFLFVPGDRPERFDKAVRSGADAVVLDLEDAVSTDRKQVARAAIGDAWRTLREAGVPLVVRTNAFDHALGEEDLRWLASLPGLAGVMVPKVESREMLVRVGRAFPAVPLLPLVESAAGWSALPELASAPGVLRLVLGHIDFVADTGLACDEQETELVPLRFAMAMATRLHRLSPPVDGVTVAIHDEPSLVRDTQRALRFGFGAKLCIHPRQVKTVHAALAPSSEAMDWAQRVIAANSDSKGAAVQVDGRMVDLPVVLKARRDLALGSKRWRGEEDAASGGPTQ